MIDRIKIITALWCFFFGCCMGSFYNVLIDRLPEDRDVIHGRSECSFCHHVLSWKDLVPVFSYLALNGKCRYCGEKLSPQYLFSELAVGGIFLTGFFRYLNTLDLWLIIGDVCLWSMLFVVAVMDYKSGIIIDQVLMIFAAAGIAARLLGGSDIRSLLLGMLIGFVFYGIIYVVARLIYKKEALGQGDVLLMAAIGAFMGPVQTLITGFLAFYCCIPFIIVNKAKNGGSIEGLEMPFGPSICIAAFIMSLWGTPITAFLMRILGF